MPLLGEVGGDNIFIFTFDMCDTPLSILLETAQDSVQRLYHSRVLIETTNPTMDEIHSKIGSGLEAIRDLIFLSRGVEIKGYLPSSDVDVKGVMLMLTNEFNKN